MCVPAGMYMSQQVCMCVPAGMYMSQQVCMCVPAGVYVCACRCVCVCLQVHRRRNSLNRGGPKSYYSLNFTVHGITYHHVR